MKVQAFCLLSVVASAAAAGVRPSHFSAKVESKTLLSVKSSELARDQDRRQLPNVLQIPGYKNCLSVTVDSSNWEDYEGSTRGSGVEFDLGKPASMYCESLTTGGDDDVTLDIWVSVDGEDVDIVDGATTYSTDQDRPEFLLPGDTDDVDWQDFDDGIQKIFAQGLVNVANQQIYASIYAANPSDGATPAGWDGATIEIDCYCGGYQTSESSTEEPCFSGETTVDVLGQGPTKMSHVSVGDKVLTSSNTYEPLLGFTHKETAKASSFLQLYADGIDAPLEVTGNHLVYTEGKAAPVPAESLKQGDKLVGLSGVHEITKIDEIVREGLYTPMTSSGDIIVNGLKASNYVMLQKGSEYAVFKNGMSTGISQHSGIHMFASPFRMMCKAGFSSVCTVEDGYLSWVEQGIKFAKYADTLNTIPQMFLLIAALALFAPIYAFEMTGVALPLFALGVIALRRAGFSAKVKTA